MRPLGTLSNPRAHRVHSPAHADHVSCLAGTAAPGKRKVHREAQPLFTTPCCPPPVPLLGVARLQRGSTQCPTTPSSLEIQAPAPGKALLASAAPNTAPPLLAVPAAPGTSKAPSPPFMPCG
ncbi:hypothetical protein NDU88_004181 [Pleurodeles waltl]|uniref:Uncharacterized protein n=1 Tax=Pleurodeles waltl TaxID=8319 RepID=A0AAV7VJK0_PLEWA|nr:hypothetical protein NDU88_004181 [Pleurodeles waltl]